VNMLVVNAENGQRWLYNNDTGWGLYMETNPGDGYVQMRRLCGEKGDVAQDFFAPEPDNCQYSCGGKDERASWCDPVSYNYGLTEDLEAKHVAYGTCPQDNKCVAFCPDDSKWTYPGTLEVHESDGCICRDLWEWNSETNQCDCLWPNTLVDGADGQECLLILGECGCPPNGIGQPPDCEKHEDPWPICKDGDQKWIYYTNHKTGRAVQACVAAWCSDPYCQVEGQCGTYTGYGDFRCRTVKHSDCSAYERCPGFKNSAGGTSVNPCSLNWWW